MKINTRMPPLPPEEWTPEAREMFTLLEGPDAYEKGSKSNVILTMARHPKLGAAFFKYNGRLLLQSKVDPALREIVILRIAFLYRAHYEWAQHVELSLFSKEIDPEYIEAYKRGEVAEKPASGLLTPEQIMAVKAGADDPIWNDLQANAIRAVDQSKDTGHMEDATWEALAAALPEKELLELLFFLGTYTMLALVLNAIGVVPEENQMQYLEGMFEDATAEGGR